MGAGASLFCKKQEELFKNKNLLEGWNTTFDELQKIVPKISFTENTLSTSLDICKKIKNTSVICIREKIESSDKIKKLIFNGIGVYEEPYTAFFLMQENKIQQLIYIEYEITTGSGRSKGIYSIVLKPRKNNTNLQNYNLIQNEDNYLVADNHNDFSYI